MGKPHPNTGGTVWFLPFTIAIGELNASAARKFSGSTWSHHSWQIASAIRSTSEIPSAAQLLEALLKTICTLYKSTGWFCKFSGMGSPFSLPFQGFSPHWMVCSLKGPMTWKMPLLFCPKLGGGRNPAWSPLDARHEKITAHRQSCTWPGLFEDSSQFAGNWRVNSKIRKWVSSPKESLLRYNPLISIVYQIFHDISGQIPAISRTRRSGTAFRVTSSNAAPPFPPLASRGTPWQPGTAAAADRAPCEGHAMRSHQEPIVVIIVVAIIAIIAIIIIIIIIIIRCVSSFLLFLRLLFLLLLL